MIYCYREFFLASAFRNRTESCVFFWLRVYARRQDCGEPNRSKYNACNNHVGKYKSKENYDRKKQDELCAQITMFKNYISDFPDSMHEV